MQQSEAQFDRDRHVSKKAKITPNVDDRGTIKLSSTFDQRVLARAKQKFSEALEVHPSFPPGCFKALKPELQKLLFDQMLSLARSDRIRSLSSEHNTMMSQSPQLPAVGTKDAASLQPIIQNATISASASMQFLADHKGRETPLQSLHNWYHYLNYFDQESAGRQRHEEQFQSSEFSRHYVAKNPYIVYNQISNMTDDHFEKVVRRSKTLACIVEYLGRGIMVFLTTLDFVR
jgi:hypothetical protein